MDGDHKVAYLDAYHLSLKRMIFLLFIYIIYMTHFLGPHDTLLRGAHDFYFTTTFPGTALLPTHTWGHDAALRGDHVSYDGGVSGTD